MEETQKNIRRVKSLYDICVGFCKDNFSISTDLLCDLPLPVVEDLAVKLTPQELFTLEDAFNNTTVTEKAWWYQVELLPVCETQNEGRKAGGCCHCCDQFVMPMRDRDLWLTYTVGQKLYDDYVLLERDGTSEACSVEFPPESYHDLRLAAKVKRIMMKSLVLSRLSPERLNAFTYNVVELTMASFSGFNGSNRWLQAISELTFKGQLQSLEIFNADPFEEIWLQLFYIISGLFGCNLCAQHFSTEDVENRLVEVLSGFHTEEGHRTRGLQHFAVTLGKVTVKKKRCSPVVPLHEALGTCMPGWPALSSVYLDTEVFKNIDCVLGGRLTNSLLRAIREGTIQSVSQTISSHEQEKSWLWEALQILSGLQGAGNTKRTQPMRLLKIQNTLPPYHRAWPWSSEEDSYHKIVPSGSVFPGLKELYLEGMRFYLTKDFSHLGKFIRGDHALVHISMLNCVLGGYSPDILLEALSCGVHPSLTCVDLHGSLKDVTDAQWQMLCQLLVTCPSLNRLGLARCGLKEKHINCDEFANAVKSHHTKRELVLDISLNALGSGVWDFMAKAVHPQSSLKELHFVQTGSTPCETGVARLRRLVRDYANHLPLLRACSWSPMAFEDISEQLTRSLEQLCQIVMASVPIERHYLKMMAFSKGVFEDWFWDWHRRVQDVPGLQHFLDTL